MFIKNGKYRIFLKVRKINPICFSFARKKYGSFNSLWKGFTLRLGFFSLTFFLFKKV